MSRVHDTIADTESDDNEDDNNEHLMEKSLSENESLPQLLTDSDDSDDHNDYKSRTTNFTKFKDDNTLDSSEDSNHSDHSDDSKYSESLDLICRTSKKRKHKPRGHCPPEEVTQKTMYNRLSKLRRVALRIGLQHMVEGHTQPDTNIQS